MTEPHGGPTHGPLGDYLAQTRAERGEGPPPLQAAQGWPAQPPMQQPYPPQQYQQPPPGYYGPPPQGYPGAQPAPRKKRRRVFLWVFLAIQVIFVIWIIAGAATKTGPTQAQIAQGCYHHAWYPLFKSQADCVTHFGGALNDAGNAGKAIGVGLVIVFWMVVDVILGVTYGVYRLATRDR